MRGWSAIANTMPMMIHAVTGERSTTSAMRTMTITTIDIAVAADRTSRWLHLEAVVDDGTPSGSGGRSTGGSDSVRRRRAPRAASVATAAAVRKTATSGPVSHPKRSPTTRATVSPKGPVRRPVDRMSQE